MTFTSQILPQSRGPRNSHTARALAYMPVFTHLNCPSWTGHFYPVLSIVGWVEIGSTSRRGPHSEDQCSKGSTKIICWDVLTPWVEKQSLTSCTESTNTSLCSLGFFRQSLPYIQYLKRVLITRRAQIDFSLLPEAIMKVITRRVHAGNIGTTEICEQQFCVQSPFSEKVKDRNYVVTRRNLAVIEGRKQVKEEKRTMTWSRWPSLCERSSRINYATNIWNNCHIFFIYFIVVRSMACSALWGSVLWTVAPGCWLVAPQTYFQKAKKCSGHSLGGDMFSLPTPQQSDPLIDWEWDEHKGQVKDESTTKDDLDVTPPSIAEIGSLSQVMWLMNARRKVNSSWILLRTIAKWR